MRIGERNYRQEKKNYLSMLKGKHMLIFQKFRTCFGLKGISAVPEMANLSCCLFFLSKLASKTSLHRRLKVNSDIAMLGISF